MLSLWLCISRQEYQLNTGVHPIRLILQHHKPDLAWLAEFAAVPGYHLLLSHEPHLLPLIPPSVELTLSGHAHGGQWSIGKRGLFAPGQGWLPKYTKGVYEGRLVVSTGLTNTAWVPRIFNPTEIVYLEPAG